MRAQPGRKARPSSLSLLAAFALVGCVQSGPPPAVPRLTVTVSIGRLDAPDSVAARWIGIGLTNPSDDDGHNLVVVALPRAAEVSSFVAALDSSAVTPPPGVALGGPEGVLDRTDTLRVVMELEPGRYLLTCLIRDSSGHRHSARGEWRWLEVTPPPSPLAGPITTVEIPLTEFAYPVVGSWPAGRHRILVVNRGRQDHLVRIDRLRPGKTLGSWMEDDGAVERTVGGVSRLGAGRSVVLDHQLEAGSYVLYCLVTDPKTGRLHADLGMVRLITAALVSAAAKRRPGSPPSRGCLHHPRR